MWSKDGDKNGIGQGLEINNPGDPSLPRNIIVRHLVSGPLTAWFHGGTKRLYLPDYHSLSILCAVLKTSGTEYLTVAVVLGAHLTASSAYTTCLWDDLRRHELWPRTCNIAIRGLLTRIAWSKGMSAGYMRLGHSYSTELLN